MAGLLILFLTFVGGLLIGRQWGGSASPLAERAHAQRPATSGSRAPSDPGTLKPPEVQRKLTFYRTLTAPPVPMPPPARPQARESREPSVPTAVGNGASQSEPVYTVQVVAYRSRPAAEEMERRLRAAGLEAYVLAVNDDDGRMTYRVRVGRFATRQVADQISERLRKDHELSPFVTTR